MKIRVELDYSLEADKNGYVIRVYPDGGRVRHHRAIAEKAAGRKLKPWEVVHHIDGDRQNNSNSNLLVCTAGYHRTLHRACLFLYGTWHPPSKRDYNRWKDTAFFAQRKILTRRRIWGSSR